MAADYKTQAKLLAVPFRYVMYAEAAYCGLAESYRSQRVGLSGYRIPHTLGKDYVLMYIGGGEL